MTTKTYTVYLLDDAYIGITTKDVEQRAQEHTVQAIRNFGTNKDKHIYKGLLDGRMPTVDELFQSVWTPEDIAAMKALHPQAKGESNEKYELNTQKRLAGQDEIAASLVFRDVLGIPLLNVAAGTTMQNLARAIAVPPTSENFKTWAKKLDLSRATNISPRLLQFSKDRLMLLPASQVQKKAKNSVTWDDQTTVMMVTIKKMERVQHQFCGPNTLSLTYYWRNTVPDLDARNFVHWDRYIDTYRDLEHFEVGKTYIIFTEKRMAPDDQHTKCWTWENNAELTAEYAEQALLDRLARIAAVRKAMPTIANWAAIEEDETSTNASLETLRDDVKEMAPDPVRWTRLVAALS